MFAFSRTAGLIAHAQCQCWAFNTRAQGGIGKQSAYTSHSISQVLPIQSASSQSVYLDTWHRVTKPHRAWGTSNALQLWYRSWHADSQGLTQNHALGIYWMFGCSGCIRPVGFPFWFHHRAPAKPFASSTTQPKIRPWQLPAQLGLTEGGRRTKKPLGELDI